MNTPHWKDLLTQCLDPDIGNTPIRDELSILTKEGYRELVFKELHSIFLKNQSLDWNVIVFLLKYCSYDTNRNQTLNICHEILEKIGDTSFTIKVLTNISIERENDLVKVVIDKYLPIMMEYDIYISAVLESDLLKEEQIETILQEIERSLTKTSTHLYYLINNPNINASQLDRVAFLLKRGPHGFSTWLHLALNPKLNISIIKNHLNLSGFNEFTKRYSVNCKQIVDRNQNKSSLHKMILLNYLPCLAEYGLDANSLDSSIEVLNE